MGVRKLADKQNIATLDLEDTSCELPVIYGTEGEKALDISALRSQTGFVALDPAYVNTGACTSGITFLDGENGILRYRGYPIEQLADKSDFIETSFLLLNAELPGGAEKKKFEELVLNSSKTDQYLSGLIRSFPVKTHPMAIASAAVLGLSSQTRFQKYLGQDLSGEGRLEVSAALMGQFKNITAEIFRHIAGLESVTDANPKNYIRDFALRMFTGTHTQSALSEKEVDDALNVLLILHADHEQNCSTSTVRLVGSSNANVFATISAGINALWGPLYGGANQAVIEMLQNIQEHGGDYKKFLAKAKDKNDPYKLMGFGHRVYKNFDPRATIIKATCDKVLSQTGSNDPLLDIAKGLEEEALKDPYFVERKLYPNVDFYSGIIYKALGIPVEMFTVMFALGRLPGWLAQWHEMLSSGTTKIGRPRQIYTGETERNYPKK